jgi:pimeloyl-ACP methyl ester carboxylesterase
LYAPSWSGLRTESTSLVEELASYGYIVVGIDHPYSSRITIFPDGRIALRKFVGDEDYSSQDGFESFVRTADQQVEIRARDASFVLDTLERLNASDPQGLLTGRLELDRVGIFGFSFGGATAAEACWRDRRFKAGLNLDGMVAGESAKQGIFAPYLVMFEDFSTPLNTDLSSASPSKRREIEFGWNQDAQIRRSLSEYGGYWIVIPGLKHLEFSDFPFFSPLRFGVTDPERTARIIRRYSLAFFDKYLKGSEEPLLNGPSRNFPEVSIQAWQAKASSERLGRRF